MRLALAAAALFALVFAAGSAAAAEHDITQWLTWRGARTLPRFEVAPTGCVEVKTGDRGEVGLSCVEIVHEGRGKNESHVYRVVVVQRVYVVRLGRVERVFDQSVSVVPLDTIDERPLTIVAVAAIFAPDGRVAEVLDDPRGSHGCAQARADLDRQLAAPGTDPVVRRWATFDRDLVARVCRGVGTYSWTGERFARVNRPASTPSGPKSPPATREAH